MTNENIEPEPQSGQQEYLENILNKLADLDFEYNRNQLFGEALGRQIREFRIEWLRSQY